MHACSDHGFHMGSFALGVGKTNALHLETGFDPSGTVRLAKRQPYDTDLRQECPGSTYALRLMPIRVEFRCLYGGPTLLLDRP
jgi:hypothetical protein